MFIRIKILIELYTYKDSHLLVQYSICLYIYSVIRLFIWFWQQCYHYELTRFRHCLEDSTELFYLILLAKREET